MGKNIISQKRGKGSMRYRAPSHRYVTDLRYPTIAGTMQGKIVDFVNDPGRNAPLALVRLDNGKQEYVLASEGVRTGDVLMIGDNAEAKVGNVVPLGKIPEGTPIFNIEIRPKDGGKMIKSTGSYAIIVSHGNGKTVVKLPSRQFKELDTTCLATVGIAGGGERTTKPIVKAGKRHYMMKARNKLYPKTSPRAMNAVNHKWGGSHMGVSKTTSRHAPPGRKVGSIAARRTGHRN